MICVCPEGFGGKQCQTGDTRITHTVDDAVIACDKMRLEWDSTTITLEVNCRLFEGSQYLHRSSTVFMCRTVHAEAQYNSSTRGIYI